MRKVPGQWMVSTNLPTNMVTAWTSLPGDSFIQEEWWAHLVFEGQPTFTPVIHPAPFQCTTWWKKSTQSDQAQQVPSLLQPVTILSLDLTLLFTLIFKVAMVLKDTQVGTQNGSFSSNTEPTDYCRSCTWHPSGVKHFSLPQKVVQLIVQ
jgi:hypothetical protein